MLRRVQGYSSATIGRRGYPSRHRKQRGEETREKAERTRRGKGELYGLEGSAWRLSGDQNGCKGTDGRARDEMDQYGVCDQV
jgi:hypothetical protein